MLKLVMKSVRKVFGVRNGPRRNVSEGERKLMRGNRYLRSITKERNKKDTGVIQ